MSSKKNGKRRLPLRLAVTPAGNTRRWGRRRGGAAATTRLLSPSGVLLSEAQVVFHSTLSVRVCILCVSTRAFSSTSSRPARSQSAGWPVLHRTFFQDRTNSCRRGSPLAKPSNLPCAPQAHVASSRRWRHRVRLDEAVISSAEGVTLFGLCEPLSPCPHLPTRVAPPPSRRCQSLTTGARGRWSSRLVPVHYKTPRLGPTLVRRPGSVRGSTEPR